MKRENFKMAVLGDVNIDIFLNIPYYPPPGGDGLAYEIEMRTGGSVTNTIIVLARLGLQTELITHIGQDPWADMAFQTLQQEGIGLDYTLRDSRAGTGLIFLPVTPDGERTMFSYRGANVLISPEEITDELFSQISLIHISGYSFLKSPQKEAAWRAVELAQEHNVPVTVDLGVEPAAALGEDLLALLGKLDLLVLGDHETLQITNKEHLDEAIQALLDTGVKTIGIKLGSQGCLIATPERQVKVPGFAVRVLDTTGAGDSFSAGMIYGRLLGLSLEGRGILANALGGLTTTVWGGGASLPPVDALKAFLKDKRSANQGWESYVDEALSSLDA